MLALNMLAEAPHTPPTICPKCMKPADIEVCSIERFRLEQTIQSASL